MLTIRDEQLNVFAEERRRQWERRVLTAIRETHAERYRELGEGAVETLIRQARSRGLSYGIRTEYDLQRFVSLAFVLGLGFEESPRYGWALPLLRDPFLSARSKVDAIANRAIQQLRQQEQAWRTA